MAQEEILIIMGVVVAIMLLGILAVALPPDEFEIKERHRKKQQREDRRGRKLKNRDRG